MCLVTLSFKNMCFFSSFHTFTALFQFSTDNVEHYYYYHFYDTTWPFYYMNDVLFNSLMW